MAHEVFGSVVDAATRCIHYRTSLDIVAIRFACCGRYYPCHACHEESAGHPIVPWPVTKRHERHVLCGECRAELRIDAYLGAAVCPACGAAFNPRCALHADLYFAPE